MSDLSGVRAALGLARWLGPWAKDAHIPPHIERRELEVPGGPTDAPMRAWRYRPQRGPVRGALLLLPGLHFLGPSDARLDRFARVLASAGLLVLAPFLPDYVELILRRSVFRDADRALDALLSMRERPAKKPAVMSISFGSLPALHLGASRADELASLTLFGGYANLSETMRFCLRGAPEIPHDPTNRPVVFMNLIEHLSDEPFDRRALMRAYNDFITTTWGRPEMRRGGGSVAVAEKILRTIHDPVARALFAESTALEGDPLALLERALARGDDELAWLDPTALMGAVRVPTYVLHGADDDVIPHTQARRFAEHIPAAHLAGVHVTGLYGHTGSSQVAIAKPAQIADEIRAMLGAIRALSSAAR